MGARYSVAAVPSPDEIRTGDVFVKNENGAYQRFEGTDEEYVELFVEQNVLKNSLHSRNILRPALSRFDHEALKRKPSLATLQLYTGDNKLQELNASVNNEAVNSKANNTQAARENLPENNCSEALFEMYQKPDRLHLRELEHCIAKTYCPNEYAELGRHLKDTEVPTEQYLRQLDSFAQCAVKQPEFPHVQKMAEKLY